MFTFSYTQNRRSGLAPKRQVLYGVRRPVRLRVSPSVAVRRCRQPNR